MGHKCILGLDFTREEDYAIMKNYYALIKANKHKNLKNITPKKEHIKKRHEKPVRNLKPSYFTCLPSPSNLKPPFVYIYP